MGEETSEPTHNLMSMILALFIVSALVLVANFLYERLLPIEAISGETKQFDGGGSVCKDIEFQKANCEYLCDKGLFGCKNVQKLNLEVSTSGRLVEKVTACAIGPLLADMEFKVNGGNVKEAEGSSYGERVCVDYDFTSSPIVLKNAEVKRTNVGAVDHFDIKFFYLNQ